MKGPFEDIDYVVAKKNGFSMLFWPKTFWSFNLWGIGCSRRHEISLSQMIPNALYMYRHKQRLTHYKINNRIPPNVFIVSQNFIPSIDYGLYLILVELKASNSF